MKTEEANPPRFSDEEFRELSSLEGTFDRDQARLWISDHEIPKLNEYLKRGGTPPARITVNLYIDRVFDDIVGFDRGEAELEDEDVIWDFVPSNSQGE